MELGRPAVHERHRCELLSRWERRWRHFGEPVWHHGSADGDLPSRLQPPDRRCGDLRGGAGGDQWLPRGRL